MATRGPEISETSSTTKILLAFFAGLVMAASGFWIATRHLTRTPPPALSTESAAHPSPTPLPVDQAALQLPPQTSSAAPDTSAIAQTPSGKASRPHAFGDDARSQTPSAKQNQPPAASAQPNTTIASAQDLPDLKPVPTDLPPVSQSGNPQPVADASGNTQPRIANEPVFRPEDQPQPAPRQPRTVTIDAGTSLVVRLGDALSTDRNATGDTFRGTLESPIVLEGFIIADKGSQVRGKIANSQKAGRVDGLSSLSLTLTEINTTDGQTVRIRTSNWEKQGEKSVGSDAAKIGAGAALGAIIGAMAGGGKGAAIGAAGGGAAGTGVVLATRGKPTVLPVETRLTFRLDAPVNLTERLNN